MDFTKFIPESVKGFLNGNGTYVTGFVSMLVAFLSMSGVDMSVFAVTPENAATVFTIGLSAILLRRGVKNEIKKLGE